MHTCAAPHPQLHPTATKPAREGPDVGWTSGIVGPDAEEPGGAAAAEEQPPAGPPRKFHVVTSAQGSAVHWQVRVHYYWCAPSRGGRGAAHARVMVFAQGGRGHRAQLCIAGLDRPLPDRRRPAPASRQAEAAATPSYATCTCFLARRQLKTAVPSSQSIAPHPPPYCPPGRYKRQKYLCEKQLGDKCEMGGFTRLLHSGEPDDLMGEVPTFVASPLPESVVKHDWYPVLNRPWAFMQWVQQVRRRRGFGGERSEAWRSTGPLAPPASVSE